MTWRNEAACKSADPTRFEPTNWPAALDTIEEFCAHCPVILACRAEGDTLPNAGGIWGGMWRPDNHNARPRSPARTLTVEAQNQRYRMIRQGFSDEQIAREQGVSVHTVTSWRSRYVGAAKPA